jgi:hypothetical protein
LRVGPEACSNTAGRSAVRFGALSERVSQSHRAGDLGIVPNKKKICETFLFFFLQKCKERNFIAIDKCTIQFLIKKGTDKNFQES